MKKIFLCLVLTILSFTSYADVAHIKAFYVDYMTNFSKGIDNYELCRSNMTDELLERIPRLIHATGIDPVIRSQDINDNCITSLDIKDLGDNWYLVQYYWDATNKKSIIQIPIKTTDNTDCCKICYITPIWHNEKYGEDLIYKDTYIPEIDHSSGLTFIKSFYINYISIYCKMGTSIEDNLHKLRSTFMTTKAISQFEMTRAHFEEDGHKGYDMLIDNYDFDSLWLNSINVIKDRCGYIFSYKIADQLFEINISIINDNGIYKIDSFIE